MVNTKKSFGDGLRAAITKKGLKYADAAEAIGISFSYLNKLMNGEKNPSLATIAKIQNAIGFKHEHFFESGSTGIEPPPLEKDLQRLVDLAHALSPSLRASLIKVAEALVVPPERLKKQRL